MSDKELFGHFRDGVFFIEHISEVHQPSILTVISNDVDERAVDSECKDNLVAAGFPKGFLPFGKTGVPSIDSHIPSKNPGGAGKGKFDVCVLSGTTLLAIVEDKIPGISVDVALGEAILYCEGLLTAKASDVRIAIGYNGKEVKWRVLCGQDPATGKYLWEAFYINGIESRAFPTPEIVRLIYSHNGLNRIVEDRSHASKKALASCINNLRQKYRQLSFIQNDNHTTIDFTIAFISLKSILEKHGDLLPKSEWKWNGLPGTTPESLKLNISECVRHICHVDGRARDARDRGCIDLAKNFRDVFFQQVKGYSFDFPDLIDEFRTTEQLESLRFIYDEVGRLPALHSSRIDLFGETYELLADKKTKAAFGQYFTGRHIIRPLIRLLLEGETSHTISGGIRDGRTTNPKKFCDPACGTGGFLTEAFKHIRDLFAKQPDQVVDVNDFARQAFFGYDIFPSNITKTKINLYLAGDGFSELESLNTLTARMTHQFDYIITNPPYGAGEVLVDSSVTGSNRLEVNFLIRIVQLLKAGGKALVVLPDGIFESPSLSPLREWLVRQCLIDSIVGLPKFAFAPYTKEKTYALFITKREVPLDSIEKAARNEERIWSYIVDNDGYANSDKRFPTGRKDEEGRWLHDELSDWVDANGEDRDCALISRWRQKEQEPSEKYGDEWGKPIQGKKFGHIRLTDVLKQEFTAYETLSKSAVLRLIQAAVTPATDALEEDEYAKYGVTIGKDAKGNQAFLSEENKPLSESAARKKVIAGMKATGVIPSKAEDLFEEDGSFKPDFEHMLADQMIIWDDAGQTFINQSKQKVTKLLNLLPEKYFRDQKVERILISDLAVEVAQVEADFKALLVKLMRDDEVAA